MPRSPLFGRRFHLAGSISEDASVATVAEVNRAREFVKALVLELLSKGANFVVPVDAEKTRPDGHPVCFDWLVWETVHSNLSRRPADAPGPLVIAVKHHKNEGQVPAEFRSVWDAMRVSPQVETRSAAHWNMASKRMEVQAGHGDILLAIGGGEGVHFLANLYHDAGKPVIPMNFNLGPVSTGASRLFDFGMSGSNAQRFFQTVGTTTPQSWLNRIEMHMSKLMGDGVRDVLGLLEDLVPPKAFVVRLVNPAHADYNDVQAFFESSPYNNRSGLADYQVNGVSAAQFIVDAAESQQIHPLMLIARMQVEASLVSKTAKPSQTRVDKALGCGCPDGGGCSSSFRGFGPQMQCGAETLRKWYDASIDGSGQWRQGVSRKTLDPRTVTPANHATASLYAYTPWVLVGSGGNWLVWNVTRKYVRHAEANGLVH